MTRYIGTAGWSLNAEHRRHVAETGTHLERYAAVFNAVEINSSFYRPHQRKTYDRWARSVPEGFRFSVKLPRTITHEARLVGAAALFETFLAEVDGLGAKLGPLIVQLAPSHSFEPDIVAMFLAEVRQRYGGALVCEPRHASWFDGAADRLLASFGVARVAADPALHAGAERPGAGTPVYYRWHGSPEVYRSAYGHERLAALASQLRRHASAWAIFDNTMLGHAFFNARTLKEELA